MKDIIEYVYKSTKEGFGDGLIELADNSNVWVISADLSESLKLNLFQNLSSDRFVECGISEQNAITVAAGISIANKDNIVLFGSFAEFLPMRCLDQIRISVCQNNLNVKLIASHSGFSYGQDGASIQVFEDISIMRNLPNMQVYAPSTALEAKIVTLNFETSYGPAYIRLNREADIEIFSDNLLNQNYQDLSGIIYTSYLNDVEFEPYSEDKLDTLFAKIKSKKTKKKLLIAAYGYMLSIAVNIIPVLESQGYDVILYNASVLKPFPEFEFVTLINSVDKVITMEEHYLNGGLFSIVAAINSMHNLCSQIIPINMKDSFGESGTTFELRGKYKLDIDGILEEIFTKLLNK